ncbi:hypothetical protein C0584_01545 [Candidatus Parcubacteria bacterium]|nr:MAG: hypothetical protein C0584_01545 [Candidatus Parcubacteria bacterium]
MKKNNQKGFTLIELLVVIAIIGLLSTLAVVSLNNARTKSRDARRIADVKQIQTALELYFTDNGEYPDQPASGVCPDSSTGHVAAAGKIAGCCLAETGGFAATCGGGTTFMGVVPDNPDPNGQDYVYTADVSGSSNDSYHLVYLLEEDTAGVAGGTPHNATPSGIVED